MNSIGYPCHSKNKNNKYYKGIMSIENGECEKCEWSKWMGGFIEYLESQGQRYALEICKDVEDRSQAQPEAVFINLDSKDERMVLEIKDLTEAYGNENDKRARNYLENNFMSNIARDIIARVGLFLSKYEKDIIYLDFLKQGDSKSIKMVDDFYKEIEKHEKGFREELFYKLFGELGTGLKICMCTDKVDSICGKSGLKLPIHKSVVEVVWENNNKDRLV